MEKIYKLGRLFSGNTPSDKKAVKQMMDQINAVGGMLHFSITREEDGWSAQCDEIPGIITGGESPNPTNEEIEQSIREAIHAAFHLSSDVRSEEVIQEKIVSEVRTFELMAS